MPRSLLAEQLLLAQPRSPMTKMSPLGRFATSAWTAYAPEAISRLAVSAGIYSPGPAFLRRAFCFVQAPNFSRCRAQPRGFMDDLGQEMRDAQSGVDLVLVEGALDHAFNGAYDTCLLFSHDANELRSYCPQNISINRDHGEAFLATGIRKHCATRI